jgi:glycosyltransferase involved in cell wall biosynthesis
MNSILFVLPVAGGSGGAHSVMQEADAMRALGVNASIATNTDNASKLRRAYRDLVSIQSHVLAYAGAEGLGALIKEAKPDVVVATTNQSVHVLAEALKKAELKDVRTAYYIQDYEPLFYAKDSSDWVTAYTSYGLIPRMTHFAKTRWLQETVEANHRVQVAKVEPSIDHKVYFPELSVRAVEREKLTVVAMLRPATPRRAPRRTVRIMNRVAHEFGDKVSCVTFGCSLEELKTHSLRLTGISHLGVLARDDVGELFREADLFLDLSDFQAFGRTAIEAMSCGTTAVVPAHGGAYEFAQDGRNGFIIDVRSDNAIMAAVRQFVVMDPVERREMMLSGIQAGYRYSPERAALSEIKLLLG